MATYKTRRYISDGNGGHNVVYQETSSDLVVRSDGTTAEGHFTGAVTDDAGAHGLRYQNTKKALEVYNETDGAWETASMIPAYATCDTAAGTQAKVAATAYGAPFTLTTGRTVRVKFTNAQTYSGQPTLNVDGAGAKNICRSGTTAGMRYQWVAGEVVEFVYDGANFVEVNGGIATTTYYGMTKLSSSTTSTSGSTAATPLAVSTALTEAKTYTDTAIGAAIAASY